jgi:tripartite-type tricarboxylate transporter receptor subunit TctC
VSAVAISLFAILPAKAQTSVESFYKGKTISILIAYPPGGSYDLYARLAAQYMGKYIPGNPNIIVQNKTGGASTLRLFTTNTPTDGTAMGIFPETIGIAQLTDPENSPWDVRKLAYIGSFSSVNSAFIIRKDAPAKTVEDFKTVTTNVGCNSPISEAYKNPELLKNLLGYQFKIICGYSGTNEFPVAMQRGEIDLVSGTWNAWRSNASIKDGSFKVLIQGGLKRHKDLPDVPLMQELVTNPDQKKVVEFLSGGAAIGRALVVTSSVPPERIAALRSAFDQAMKDPDLLALAAKSTLEIDPTPGAEVQRISEAILDTPKSLVDMAVEAEK